MSDSFAKYRIGWIPTGLIDFFACTFVGDGRFKGPSSQLQRKLNRPKRQQKASTEEWITIQSTLDRLIESILTEWDGEEEAKGKTRWLLHYLVIFILARYSVDIARACFASQVDFKAKQLYIIEHPEAKSRYNGVQLKDIQPFGLSFNGIKKLLGEPPSGCGCGYPKNKAQVVENAFFPAFDLDDPRNGGWAKAFSAKAAKHVQERFPDRLFQTWKDLLQSQFKCSVHITLSHQKRRYCGSVSDTESLKFLGFSADGTRLNMRNQDRIAISGWKMPWGGHTIQDDAAFNMSVEEALRDDVLDDLVAIPIDGRNEIRYFKV